MRDVPLEDYRRLPFKGLQSLALSTRDTRLLSAIAPLTTDLFIADDELLALLNSASPALDDAARAHATQAAKERETQREQSIAAQWADENTPTPQSVQTLVSSVLEGDKKAVFQCQAWVERFQFNEPTSQKLRSYLGAALVAALPHAQPARQEQLMGWLGEMEFWEEVDAIATAVGDNPRYTELLVELRERAAEGSRTLQENDFSGL